MIKNIIYILIIIITTCTTTLAYEQFNDDEENIYGYKFSKKDSKSFLKNANGYLLMWENCKDENLKKIYLQEAMRYYYLLSKVDKTRIEAHIGLGKVYDEMNLDRYAIKHFYMAYNINNKNPDLNYKFGDFYFKRDNLYKAQYYFNRANIYGYSKYNNLNLKMAKMYNKLADKEKTKQYFIKAISHVDNDIERAKKIRLLDELNSSDPLYYLFIK